MHDILQTIRCHLFPWTLMAIILWSTPVQSTTKHRVLVLNSYNIGMAWEDHITRSLLAELEQSDLDLEIFIEHMDSKRFPNEILFSSLATLYAEKYATPPDILIVADDNALDFVIQNRDVLFRHIPVVFCGVNHRDKAYQMHDSGFTGLIETVDIQRTLELILKLHPDTKHITAIADAVPTAALHLQHYYAVAAKMSATVKFNDLSNWTFAEVKEALAHLPENSVLLYLSVFRDRDGQLAPPSGGYDFLLKHTALPVYTLWGNGAAGGVVGGFVADGTLHGRYAAQLALRILRGESTRDLPILDQVGNRPMFDFWALQAHHIPLAQLPENSVVLNEPESFY